MENQIVCIFFFATKFISINYTPTLTVRKDSKLKIIDLNCHPLCDSIGSVLKVMVHLLKKQMAAMSLMFSSINHCGIYILYIIGGFILEMLVWILGEILENFVYLFIYWGQKTLGNYQTEDKLCNIIFLAILTKAKLEKSN